MAPHSTGTGSAAASRRLAAVAHALDAPADRPGCPAASAAAAASSEAGAECISVVDGPALEKFAKGVLTAIGADEYCAAAVAEGLTEASLRGVDSHGIRLLPNYVENCLAGGVNPTPNWGVSHPFPSICVLDADDTFGLAAGRKAMDIGMAIAATQGVCMLAVQNSHHPGAMAATTLYAARKGFISWGHTNTGPKLANFGASGSTFGTNPVAFAAPRGTEEDPFSLDMATSMIPWNKVEHHRATGGPLPEGVATTVEGVPTSDAAETQYLLPAGGYKGFGLAAMVEILSCVFTGMKFGDETQPMYGPKSDVTKGRGVGQFYLVARADGAVPQESFESELRRMSEAVRAVAPLEENGPAPQFAGDPEVGRAKLRGEIGIPLDGVVTDGLKALAAAHGVDLALREPTPGVEYEIRA